MSDLTTYRQMTEAEDEAHRYPACPHIEDHRLQDIADGVAGYAFVQGGLSGAMYQCDKDEAEYALIPIDLLDALEGTDK